MNEHSLVLEAGIAPGNTELVEAAGGFRRGFNNLLNEAVRMADGNVSRTVLESQEIVTDRTLEAEETEELGVDIDTALTKMEMMLRPGGDPGLEDAVRRLNSQAINLTRSLADFKTTVLNESTGLQPLHLCPAQHD